MVAPLDRVKILFQTSNPDFQKYAGALKTAFTALEVTDDDDRVQEHGGVLTSRVSKFIGKQGSMASYKDIQQLSCVSSLTLLSNT